MAGWIWLPVKLLTLLDASSSGRFEPGGKGSNDSGSVGTSDW